MQKISIKKAGGYERLEFIDAPTPTPKANEVLIKTKACGVNYADVLVRLGVYESAKEYVGWPITPGFEVSGEIKAVGSEVTNFRIGQKVVGFTLFNGYSTEICIAENQVMELPPGFNLIEAAGFPAVFMTAYHALCQIIHIPKNGSVLIHSAAGGVGTALIQVAKSMGLKVIGVVGASHKVEYVKNLGADIVIDKSKNPDFWKDLEKVDVAFDANGFSTYWKSYKALKPMGKLVAYGSHSLIPRSGGKLNYFQAAVGLWKTPRFNPLSLISHNKSVIGFNVSFLFSEKIVIKENLAGLFQLASQGKLKPIATTSVPFKEVARAHQLIESGQSTGKIVLLTDS